MNFFKKNGVGFSYYLCGETPLIGVKNNIITSKLDDRTYIYPDQYKEAKRAIFSLYDLEFEEEIKIDEIITNFGKSLLIFNNENNKEIRNELKSNSDSLANLGKIIKEIKSEMKSIKNNDKEN